MCGIFGFYLSESSKAFGEEVLASMGEAIRHRGPDDEGFFLDGPIGLGMRRLSIIDLKTGRQPIRNEDGSLQVVFNGEIYNYRELTRDLMGRGHRFYTTSDTEVIVHLYEEYGKECVQHLRGMFAVALWDTNTRTLFLVRDRLGIKPLYYAHLPSGVIFASELKSILRCPGFRREVNMAGLMAYLQYGYVPDPLSILRDVSKLPPGHSLAIRRGAPVELTRYWDPATFFETSHQPASEQALVEELRCSLAETTRMHLVSDVPLGAFLSGGVDSSAVVAMMAAELGQPVKTFSIGFREAAFNELPYARLAAERIGTEHYELVVGPDSLDRLEGVVDYFDEPFADASAIPTYFVSMLAREYVKVVLSGDGGDELFAGYDRYVVDYRRKGYDLITRTGASGLVRWISEAFPEAAPGKNYLYNISLPRMERYLDSISHFAPRRLRQLLSGDLLAELHQDGSDGFAPYVAQSQCLDFPSRLQYLDLKTYLPGDILTKVDRMSMAHSLEARVPLLDHRLVEFVARIPSRYKFRNGQTKYLFKQAIQGIVPPETLSRKKQGFAVPLEYWFRDGLQSYLQAHLLSGDALQHGYFDRSFVERLFQLYTRTGKPEYVHRLWTLLVFELWYRACISGKR